MLMKTVGDGAHLDPSRAYRGIALVERFIEMQPEDAWVNGSGGLVRCPKNGRLAETKRVFPQKSMKIDVTDQT